MNYTFTKREKTLILVLVLALLFCGYWFAIAMPVQNRIAEANEQEVAALDESVVEEAKAQQLQKMRDELADLDKTENFSQIPNYDNLDRVMVQLGAILSTTKEYSLTFGELEYRADLVCRPISMDFTAANYAAAKNIIKNLYGCIYRCSINGISIVTDSGDEVADVTRGRVNVSLAVTFYEQMTGGAQAPAAS